MAFGSNHAERSKKTDLITRISIHRIDRMHKKEVSDSIKGYRSKTVDDLKAILRKEYADHPYN